MAASSPTITGVAPSDSANATRITPPLNAPDMLAHARSRTSARSPAARASGVTVGTGSSIGAADFYQATPADGVSACRKRSCGQRAQVALQHRQFRIARPPAARDRRHDVAAETLARVVAQEAGADQQLRE